MYYDVAYANIKIIKLLDKLLTIVCIDKIKITFVQNIFNIIFVAIINTYIDVKIQSYFCH